MIEKQIYTRECNCCLCGSPAVVESLTPIASEDEVGVICENCAAGELGPKPDKRGWISADQLPANVDYGWSDRMIVCQFIPGDRHPTLMIASYDFHRGQWCKAMGAIEYVTHYQPLPAYPDFPEETK